MFEVSKIGIINMNSVVNNKTVSSLLVVLIDEEEKLLETSRDVMHLY